MCKIVETIIVGGGPAGLLAALNLESDAIILEARKSVGEPPHCTGLVSTETANLLPREAHLDHYKCIEIVLELGKYASTLNVYTKLVRIARPLLEKLLSCEAEAKGIKVRLATPVYSVRVVGKLFEVVSKDGAYKAHNLLLAEGHTATFSRLFGLAPARIKRFYAEQWLVSLERRIEEDIVKVFFGPRWGRFAWIVPTSYGRRALLGSNAGDPCKVKHVLSILCRKITCKRLLSRTSGVVLEALPRKKPCVELYGKRVCAFGDSAGMVKSLTGGGLYAITRLARGIVLFLDRGLYDEVLFNNVLSNLKLSYVFSKLIHGLKLWVATKCLHDAILKLLRRHLSLEILDYDSLRRVAWVVRKNLC